MNPITYRPKTWNQVVGQDRAIRLLQTLLSHGRLLPRGFIFEGSYGTGKTSTAYLTARALMCLTPGSTGCGTCASCQVIDSEGIEGQNVHDFKEIDAAQNSGVEQARLIAAPDGWGEAPPSIARRRVTVIDEAHRLSMNAWDVYLKPLEQSIDYSAYIFVTNESQSIPSTISSRCVRVRFGRVSEEDILGLLTATAARDKVPYETDALALIAHRSAGAPRVAMKYFGQVASTGRITVDFVEALVEDTLENKVLALWEAILTKNQKTMTAITQDITGTNTVAVLIEKLCTTYSQAIREPKTELDKAIRVCYHDVPATTSFFLKWMAVPALPADAALLFTFELMMASNKVWNKPTPKVETDAAEELFT
ncbi:Replication factor C small subunit [uncultured archaeon]|nr:Replication factor C small subunit [uncultured archaeon]